MGKRLSIVVVVLALAAVIAPPSATAAPVVRAMADPHASAVQTGFAHLSQPERKARPNVLPPGYQLWNLQLNLCNSGYAGCYKGGQSIPEGQQVISTWLPDVVTVNEVCLPDVRDHLYQTMLQTWGSGWVFWAFMPAWNSDTNAPYQCKDGRGEYGNGIIGHVAEEDWQGVDVVGGIYEWQDGDPDNNEWRSWVCAYAIDNYYGCGTHLAANNSTAADLQCNDLLRDQVPAFWASEGVARPTVVGGDFNLHYQGSPDIQDCVPAGWYRKGDGDVQHWFITSELTFDFSQEIGMSYTDHPGWLVATVMS